MDARLKIALFGSLRVLLVCVATAVVVWLLGVWGELKWQIYLFIPLGILYWFWKAYKKPTPGKEERFFGMTEKIGWIIFAVFIAACVVVMILSKP